MQEPHARRPPYPRKRFCSEAGEREWHGFGQREQPASCRRSSAWEFPSCGKNLFPSNIQGLPTWYEIRVNKDGYAARALDYDLMVAMNGQTYDRDIKEVRSGGYLLYDSSWPLDQDLLRDDVTFLGVPLAEMCNGKF